MLESGSVQVQGYAPDIETAFMCHAEGEMRGITMTSIAVHTASFFAVWKHPMGSCTGAGNVFKLPQEQMIKDILLMKYYRYFI